MFVELTIFEALRPLRSGATPLISRWSENIGLYLVNIMLLCFVFTSERLHGVFGEGATSAGSIVKLDTSVGELPR